MKSIAIGIEVVYITTPIMEGIAGIFTPGSFFAINATMTTTHGLWAVCHLVNLFSVLVFGGKIGKLLAHSIEFHKDTNAKATQMIAELQQAHYVVRELVASFTNEQEQTKQNKINRRCE